MESSHKTQVISSENSTSESISNSKSQPKVKVDKPTENPPNKIFKKEPESRWDLDQMGVTEEILLFECPGAMLNPNKNKSEDPVLFFIPPSKKEQSEECCCFG